jgi:cobalt-zinc-cadmium efflux system membrane fusion protein
MKTILAALTIILSFAACRCQQESAAQPAAATPPADEVWITPQQLREGHIQTTLVSLEPVGNSLAATGRVTFSDVRVSHVFSPVTGRVTSVLVSLGERVRQGQPLAVIQSPDMGSALSDVTRAEADLAAAQRDYERQKELYDAHAAAQRDFEAAESTYRKAKAERDRAADKSRLLGGRAESPSYVFVLRAPIDGEVVARNVNLGAEVQGQYSGGNAPELFTVGNLDRVWVMADVFEVDLPRVREGIPAYVNVVAFPGKTFYGTVDWISGSLDPQTRTAKVRCTIDNREHLLRPEMYATVAIQTEARRKLAIPRSAVVRLADTMVVFVDKGAAPNGGERFERRLVSVDETQAADYVPVVSGVQRGEKIVSSGAVILSGGSA